MLHTSAGQRLPKAFLKGSRSFVRLYVGYHMLPASSEVVLTSDRSSFPRFLSVISIFGDCNTQSHGRSQKLGSGGLEQLVCKHSLCNLTREFQTTVENNFFRLHLSTANLFSSASESPSRVKACTLNQ